jgi:TolA-binding protein
MVLAPAAAAREGLQAERAGGCGRLRPSRARATLGRPRPGGARAGARAGRLASGSASASADPHGLAEKARRAFDAGRFGDAAEYARQLLVRGGGGPARGEILMLRGNSLLRAGMPRDAAASFDTLLKEQPQGAQVPEALAGEVRAREALGDSAGPSRRGGG